MRAAAGLAEPLEERTSEELRGPVKRWLDEDVAYFIKSGERARFVQLATEAEHEDIYRVVLVGA